MSDKLPWEVRTTDDVLVCMYESMQQAESAMKEKNVEAERLEIKARYKVIGPVV